jgi:2,5-diketo-D-gluconate reductase B
VTAIPKATSEAHIADNWASLSLDLDDEDVATIDAIEETDRRVDPGFAPW